MNGTPKYARRAQVSATAASAVEYIAAKAVIQMATATVTLKNAAVAGVSRRRSSLAPNARISTAVSATGIAAGENAYTADMNADMVRYLGRDPPHCRRCKSLSAAMNPN